MVPLNLFWDTLGAAGLLVGSPGGHVSSQRRPSMCFDIMLGLIDVFFLSIAVLLFTISNGGHTEQQVMRVSPEKHVKSRTWGMWFTELM